MQQYKGLHNHYTTGREIGRGGEGQVFEVRENASLVAKIYTDPPDADKTAKLQYMVTVQDQPFHQFAAWPKDLITDASGNITGFVMRRLDGFVPLHMLFSPMDRKKLFPDKGYNFLAHVARNVATAFHQLHTAGFIVGDINEGNILVDNKGMVAFIDCDSFQVNNNGRYHFCEVGVPRYTPPELLEKGSFENVVRTANTDSFSLAILLFQLLFLGRHPYAGRNLSKEDIDEEKAIRLSEFAYSLRKKHKKLSPPLNSFDITNLPAGIGDLFHKTFEQRNSRPIPAQWVKELDLLTKSMATCAQSKLHTYPGHLTNCPWCHYKNNRGPVYFLDDSYLQSIPDLQNMEQFINGFKVERLDLKKLSIDYNITPSATGTIPPEFTSYRRLHFIILGLTGLSGLGLAFISSSFLFGGAFAALLFHYGSPWRRRIDAELQQRRELYHSLKERLEQTTQQYNSPPELPAYNHLSQEVARLIHSFRNLPAEFTQLKKQAEERLYNTQLQLFLQQFHISSHTIPGFGPGKKNNLYKNGIVNAAHISHLHTVKVLGMGPKNIQVLLTWQRQVASGFTYIPDHQELNRESLLITEEIARKKSHLEAAIRTEYKNLLYNKSQLLSRLSALEYQHHQLIKQVQESATQYEVFKKLAVWRKK